MDCLKWTNTIQNFFSRSPDASASIQSTSIQPTQQQGIFSFIGPHAQDPIVEHLEVLARKSFNTTLICLVYESEEGCPDDLRWYANGRPLRNSGKYEILEKKTQSKCKREFRLTIFNVTKNDEGNYSCHWICEYFEDKIATIKLKVSVESITGKSFHVSLLSSVS